MKLKSIKKNIPLSQKAYEIIKDAIINNTLKPGSILAEEPLSKQLSISRTPIRAALQQLVYEGLAECDSTNHIIVSNVTKDDIKNISVVRCNLECLCIQLIETPLEKNCIDKLENILDNQLEVLSKDKPNYIDYINLDYDFHIYLAELTKNNYLIEVIGKLNQITNRFLMLSDTLEQHCRTAIDEHKTIVQFLKDGQKDYAEIAMRNHIINVGNRLL